MKTIRILGILIFTLLFSCSSILAASPSNGIVGNKGDVLSKIEDHAGSGEYGKQSGGLLEASFRMPQGIAITPNGTLLIADTRNQIIRKINTSEVTVYAGFSELPLDSYQLPTGALLDGKIEEAVFHRPQGLAIDKDGNVYVADSANHAIRKITTKGKVETIAGDGIQGNRNGTGQEARFYHPSGIAIANDGSLYVADTGNHLIRKITKDGTVTTLNAHSNRFVEIVDGEVTEAGDFQDGLLHQAKFNEPTGIAIDKKGNVYVSDTGNRLIRYIDLQQKTVSTVAGQVTKPFYQTNALFGGSGFRDGDATTTLFASPKGIALTAEDGLVIADSGNHAIRYLYDGKVTTLAGSTKGIAGDIAGVNSKNRLHNPVDVAVASNGTIYIADTNNNKIKQWTIYELPQLLDSEAIKVVFEQKQILFDVDPEVKEGRTMVPVRAIMENFDYNVSYNYPFITLEKDNKEITFQVNSNKLEVKEQGEAPVSKTLDVMPYVKDNRFFVPIRFFSEEIGLDVQWYGEKRTVIIRQ